MSSDHDEEYQAPPLAGGVTLDAAEILELTSGEMDQHSVDDNAEAEACEDGQPPSCNDPRYHSPSLLQECRVIDSNSHEAEGHKGDDTINVTKSPRTQQAKCKSNDPFLVKTIMPENSTPRNQVATSTPRSASTLATSDQVGNPAATAFGNSTYQLTLLARSQRLPGGSPTERQSSSGATSSGSIAFLDDATPGAIAVGGPLNSVTGIESHTPPNNEETFAVVAEAEQVNEAEEGRWKERATNLQQTLDSAPRAQVVTGQTKSWVWLTVFMLALGLVATIIVIAVILAGRSNDGESFDEGDTQTQLVSNPMQDDIFLAPSSAPAPVHMMPVSLPPTIQLARERGVLRCRPDPDEIALGHGFSSDVCRAIAAAILGEPDKVEFTIMPFKEQFMAVANGTTDVTTGLTFSTMERDLHVAGGLRFSTPYVYSGNVWIGIPDFVDCVENQDMLVGECRDIKICVLSGGLQEAELEHISHPLHGAQLVKVKGSSVNIYSNFADGLCNVAYTTAMGSFLQNARENNHSAPLKMSERIYNTIPLALVSRNEDTEFGDIVNWIVHSMTKAEAFNITQGTAHLFPETSLFGSDTTIFQRALAVLGNYAEVYQKAWQSEFPRQAINSLNMPPHDGGLLFPRPLGKLDAGSVGRIIDAKFFTEIGQQGALRCGLLTGRQGLATWNATLGYFVGLDADQCRALAAALFAGDTSRLEFVEFESEGDGFVGLAEGMIDVLAGAEYSMGNDIMEETTGQGYTFSDIYYYDQQGSETTPIAMATLEGDPDWSDFVGLIAMASLHAEASGINQTSAVKMPVLDVYGRQYSQALRDAVLNVGNYAEMYERNMEQHLPRAKNNINTLNSGDTPIF